MTWIARLALDYRFADGRTVLSRRHEGPLRVQKALYPEGERLCHTLIVHPPGGIAGGDELGMEVGIGPGAQALLTTPGATKWYKAHGRPASQSIHLDVQGGVEWLPQEAIVFNQADVNSSINVALAPEAATIGWDIVALGRSAADETFDAGCFTQTICLSDDGKLQWIERTRLQGGDPLLQSPVGLAGNTVFGCLWAAGPTWRDDELDQLRTQLPAYAAPITRVAPRLLLARVLAASTPAARAALTRVWQLLRPRVFEGRPPMLPRIWAT